MRAIAAVLVAALAVVGAAPTALADERPAADGSIEPRGQAAVAPQVEGAKDLRLARGLGRAGDMRGVLPSLYRGRWFVKKAEDTRRCIVRRETHGNYRSVGAGGRFRGAYQLNRSLAIGATHRMEREVRKEMGPAGVELVRQLRKTPTQQWNRYWQDRAFWTIWAKGDGASHWRGAGCGKRA